MEQTVSPACAGMIPAGESTRKAVEREPRMRGDDPVGIRIGRSRRQ